MKKIHLPSSSKACGLLLGLTGKAADAAAIYGGGAAWGARQPSGHGAEVNSLRRWSPRRRQLEVGEGPDERARGGTGIERGVGQSKGERGKRRGGMADQLRREQRQVEGEGAGHMGKS